ncbi:MAG: DUF5666 domain-containing protein, partial [Pseudonocardiaceae bacterium]
MNRWLFGPSLGLAAVAVASSACGTAGTSTAGQPTAPSSAPAATAGPRGASGTVAALGAANLQVQNPRSGQVTVTFTPSTSFTTTVPATVADLMVGDCVRATGAAAPTSSPADPAGPLTATSVMITPAGADGGCPGGGSGGAGRGARPAGRGGRVAPAAGKITSASPGGFVLQTSNATRAVTTTQATTFSKTVATDHSALAVGQCVTAAGPSDDTGTVTASSISIRQPGPQGCQG